MSLSIFTLIHQLYIIDQLIGLYGHHLEIILENKSHHIARLILTHMSKDEADKILSRNPYSDMWHACKDGNLEMVKVLLEYNPESLYKHAPDGTFPAFMAFVKKRDEVLKYLEEKGFKISFNETEFAPQEETFLCQLTKSFPVFNSDIESNNKCSAIMSDGLRIDHFNYSHYILGDLCPVKGATQSQVFIDEIEIMSCEEDCKK